jgi:putative DNA primase/helicase
MLSRDRSASHGHDFVDMVDEQLRNLVADLVSHFHGGPGNHRGNEARWGKKGGLKADIAGPNKGRIIAFDGEGKGLTPLQYIMSERNCSFAEAVEWAAHWLGVSPDYKPDPATGLRRKMKRENELRKANTQALADKAERVEKARALYQRSKEIVGTAAERYLTARGISCELPEGIMYLPAPSAGGYEALVVVAKDSTGSIQAVQRVFLEDDMKAPIKINKRTNGSLESATVRLPARLGIELVLVEGPETGLSVWQAWGRETWIALGSISKLTDIVPVDRTVVIARDADKPNSPADTALTKAVKAMLARGISVSIALPPKPTKSKYDFNDALMDYGNGVVADALFRSVQMGANPLPKSLPLDVAREVAQSTVANFFRSVSDGNEGPLVHFANVGLGVGKTRTALQEVGRDNLSADNAKGTKNG